MKHVRRAIHHLRARRIITKWKILAVLLFCNILFLLHIFIITTSMPNTYIGDYPIGLKSRHEVQKILMALYETPLLLNVNNQQYSYTYDHLGVYLDPHEAIQEIFLPNKQFPKNIFYFFQRLIGQKHITIPLSFSAEYYQFLEKTVYDQNNGPDIVYVDQSQKSVALYEGKKQWHLEKNAFSKLLIDEFGKINALIKAPLEEINRDIKDKITIANARLQYVYSKPLTVIVQSSQKDVFFTFQQSDLVAHTIATVSDTTGDVNFIINAKALFPQELQKDTSYKKISDGIASALSSRVHGDPAESVRVLLDSGPNTDGTLAKNYIEVDISQQKMFAFKDNTLFKTYRVSTGKDYPTPTGTFTILNKYNLGYSAIYNVWMPWWMAFAYSNKLHAYFGIHELPYFYTGTAKIQRPREFIGSPNTGGCIALDIGDAKEVYQFARVGMPVVVNL